MKNHVPVLYSLGLSCLMFSGCVDMNDPMIVRHQAMLAEQKGDLKKALHVREEFIKASPDYYYINEVHFEQGLTYLEQNQLEKALEHFNRAIEEDPEYLQAFIRRCQVHARLGNHELALQDGRRVLELSESDRNLASVFLVQGDSYEQLKNHQLAVAYWRLSLIFDSAQIPALQRLFDDHMEAREYKEALQLIEESLRINERIAAKQLMHSRVLAQLQRTSEAQAALERAREWNIGTELTLPESVEELTEREVQLEEAPMVLPLVKTQPAASETITDNEAIQAAREFLLGVGVTAKQELKTGDSGNPIVVCEEDGKTFEVVIKINRTQQSETLELSQQELNDITSQTPPRGMLVIAETQNDSAGYNKSGQVTAFARSWQPDPARMVPVRYEYQIPKSTFPTAEN